MGGVSIQIIKTSVIIVNVIQLRVTSLALIKIWKKVIPNENTVLLSIVIEYFLRNSVRVWLRAVVVKCNL